MSLLSGGGMIREKEMKEEEEEMELSVVGDEFLDALQHITLHFVLKVKHKHNARIC